MARDDIRSLRSTSQVLKNLPKSHLLSVLQREHPKPQIQASRHLAAKVQVACCSKRDTLRRPVRTTRSMQSREENDIMSLREHLLAAQAGQPVPPSTSPTSSHEMHIAHSPNQHIDPAIGGGGGPGYPMPMDDSMEDQMNDMRKGRRELSTSKRAAQNRAAQRAFRQRKEQYIQSLKDQVKEHQNLAANYETIQKENFSLRQYIITLQARLLESHTELPPPPESIDLSRPPPTIETSAPQAPMGSGSIGDQLQAAAAAAAAAEASEGRQSYPQHHQGGRMPEADGNGGAGSRESSDGA